MLRATYHDGRTSLGSAVGVRIEADALVIVADDDGRELDRWAVADVRFVDAPRRGAQTRLRPAGGDARLTLTEGADVSAIAAACPNLRKADVGAGTGKRVAFWVAAAGVSVFLVVTVLIPAFAGWVAAAMPAGLERRLGDRVAEQVVDFFGRPSDGVRVCAGNDGEAAVLRVAETLARGHDGAAAVRVRVLRTDAVNAVALPGGHVLVFGGLIAFAEHPNEFVGVLAHEIAHVALRHPLEVAVERTAVAVLIGLFVGDVFGGAAIATVGKALAAGAYSRDAEREADALGVELMNRAGFDASPLGDLLARLADEHGNVERLLGYFATHPESREREAAVRAAATGGGAALTDAEWAAVQAICGGAAN